MGRGTSGGSGRALGNQVPDQGIILHREGERAGRRGDGRLSIHHPHSGWEGDTPSTGQGLVLSPCYGCAEGEEDEKLTDHLTLLGSGEQRPGYSGYLGRCAT